MAMKCIKARKGDDDGTKTRSTVVSEAEVLGETLLTVLRRHARKKVRSF